MSILRDIVARTRADLETRKQRTPLADLETACAGLAPPRDLAAAVRRSGLRGGRRGPIRAIAEVKKASPSRGLIRPDFAPADLAGGYATAGAAAVSVLTDQPFFHGSLQDLRAVRRSVQLPLLRKDFHVDPYQVWEARAAGADAVLLIVAALPDPLLHALLRLARSLGLAALVEVHTRAELRRAIDAGAELIGINNRDLRDFSVRLAVTFDLLPHVPAGTTVVSESGIGAPEDVARLAAADVDAILVGEGLLRRPDPGAALRALLAGGGAAA
jgi:indole-3-glycerol phosphate synthase